MKYERRAHFVFVPGLPTIPVTTNVSLDLLSKKESEMVSRNDRDYSRCFCELGECIRK